MKAVDRFPSDSLLSGLLDVAPPFVRDPVTEESRHGLTRIRRDGSSWILKVYSQSADPFFDHRFRREEKMLAFCHRHDPGLAPRAWAGVISGCRGFLLMEDLGVDAANLHDRLSEAPDETTIYRLAAAAVATLVRLHRLLDRFEDLLAAFSQSIVLDRNDHPTLIDRFLLGRQRLGIDNNRANEDRFGKTILEPLLARPGRPIHNSANALNFVCPPHGPMRIIDFETIALGPREFDLAELAINPVIFDRIGLKGLSDLYHSAGGVVDDEFAPALARAALVRAIDGAGTLAERTRRFKSPDQAARSATYLETARTLALQLGAEGLI